MTDESAADPFPRWLEALWATHARSLTFTEIRKGVVALSRLYVQRRSRLEAGAVFQGAGKRAAFACFYTPLHFLLVREVVRALGAPATVPPPRRIVDFGCGLAPAGAAWALEAGGRPRMLGVDRSSWAVGEARETLRCLGLRGRVQRAGPAGLPRTGAGDALVSAFAINELGMEEREAALHSLLRTIRAGGRVLVVEPIAKGVSPWWSRWAEAFRNASGRADEWRFGLSLPEPLEKLDRAAGLDHGELTARTLFAAP